MDITLNGEEYRHSGEATVGGLLAALSLEARKIAVERNREIVPRSQYDATPLAAGDAIEIVQFVGGG